MTNLTDIGKEVAQIYGIKNYQSSAIYSWIEAQELAFDKDLSETGQVNILSANGKFPKLPFLNNQEAPICFDVTFKKDCDTLVNSLTACPASGIALSIPGFSGFKIDDLMLSLDSRITEFDVEGEKILIDSLSASFRCTIHLSNFDVPILILFPLGGSSEWTLVGSFASIDLGSTLEKLTELAGGDPGWMNSLPPQVCSLGSFAIKDLRVIFDPTVPSVSQISLEITSKHELEIIPEKLSIEDPRIYINIDHPIDSIQRSVYGTFNGTVQVGGEKGVGVDLSAEVPKMLFSGALAEGSSISLRALAEGLLPAGTDMPGEADIVLNDFNVTVDISEKAFSMFARCYSDWEIIPKVIFSSVQTDVQYRDGCTAFRLISVFTIGSVDVTLSADHPKGEDGWQFEGRTGTGQNIPIGKLLEDLAGKFSVTTKPELPSALDDLTVKNLSVAFNTKSKDFKFTCEADLPTSAQSSLAIQLVIDVKHDDNGGCQFELSGQFDVEMDAATKLEFKLQFEHGGNTDKLIAIYHHDEKLPLNISALLKALAPGDHDLTNLIAGLDIAVDVKDVQLAFYKESAQPSGPSKSLFGMILNAEVSFSNPANTERIVAEINSALFASFERAPANSNGGQSTTSKFLFGLKIGAELSVANLPLIGRDLPLEQPVGVKDLQLFVASQPILAGDMEQVNNLLGADKIPSPQKEEGAVESKNILEYGVTLNATLLLGTESRTLVLAPSGSKSPASEGMHDESTPEATGSLVIGTNQPEGQDTKTPAVITTQVPTPSVKWIKIQKSFGPIRFDRIGFQFQDQVIWFLLDASLAAAGLTLSFDGLGFGSELTQFKPQFDLRGLGIHFKKDPVEIGGAFLKTPDGEYGGNAILKTSTLSLFAIGLYKPGENPSMFVYAFLDYPLGGPTFFYVTGLAAGFGYNRALKMPTVDKVKEFPLVAEVLSDEPKDATPGDPSAELAKLTDYVQIQTGQYFLVAGVKFTSFKMIDSFAMLAVSFGEHLEIDILGVSTIKVPFSEDKKANCLAEIQIAFKASFIPADGFLGVIAQLTPSSYILSKSCQLTGGMAFYSWFSGEHAGDFILTVGGYHSQFKVPAHYPQVPALAINWPVDSHLSIKGDAYFALTPSALMAGGHLQAIWQSGPIKAWFTAGADFLIAWKPFHYDAAIYVNMGVSYTFWFFGTRHISVELGANLHIWGPEFSGVAHIHLWCVSFSVSFGAGAPETPKAIEWSEFQASFLPNEILSVSVKNGLISANNSSDNLGVINPKDFSLVVDSFIPIKKLNGVVATYQINEKQIVGTSFGIAPMDKSDLETNLAIEVKREGDDTTCSQFKFTSITKNVPAGLWGTKFQPGLDSDPLVRNVISGVEITPVNRKDPLETVMIDSSELQSASEIEELHVYGKKDILLSTDRSKVDQDPVRRQSIQESLSKPNEKRQKMLEGLGLEDMNITINEKIADVFMVAPQIEP